MSVHWTVIVFLAFLFNKGACKQVVKNKVHFHHTTVLIEKDYDFAHEAPVYLSWMETLFFTSAVLNETRETRVNETIVYENQSIIRSHFYQVNQDILKANLSIDIPMPNGAWVMNDRQKILVCAQGNQTAPAGIYALDPNTLESRPLLIEFQGKPFNSPNDLVLKVNTRSTRLKFDLWFTDPYFGFIQDFRPNPQLPSTVYHAMYDPISGNLSHVDAVITDMMGPNGIAVSPKGDMLYVTETGYFLNIPNAPNATFAFDILQPDSDFPTVTHKRLFATAKKSIPDGMKIDSKNRVYICDGEGLIVYDGYTGDRLGACVLPNGCSNFALAQLKNSSQEYDTVFLMGQKQLWKSEIIFNE